MNIIVAVYDNWGIGLNGTQPIVLNADRKFFRQITNKGMIIAGRKTIEDFPDKKPLPNRRNVVLTQSTDHIDGFIVCHSVDDAMYVAEQSSHVFVIGGGSIFRQMLPICDTAYVTKIHVDAEADTYFPNLDTDENWEIEEIIQSGEEDGIKFDICKYRKIRYIKRDLVFSEGDRVFEVSADYRSHTDEHYKYYVRSNSIKDAKVYFQLMMPWMKVYTVRELKLSEIAQILYEHNELQRHVVFWGSGLTQQVAVYY